MELEDFDLIHDAYEKKLQDLHKLKNSYNISFSRYILIRSLDVPHLMEILQTKKEKIIKLYKKLYLNIEITNQDIIKYIKKKYPEEKMKRQKAEENHSNVLKDFGEVVCGIPNDDLNEEVKSLIRDKSIKNKEDLEKNILNVVDKKIIPYLKWQYYNQTTNDLIENFFYNNEKIIPTLRKIKYIDFFIQDDIQLEEVIPFDLKITHISDEFFDLFSKGLTPSEGEDSYIVGEKLSEMEEIKNFYKTYKKEFNLPNYGKLKKIELIDILSRKKNESEIIQNFLIKIYSSRENIISQLPQNLKAIEWWNYKYQGERLFKNNNRFFVFLVYLNDFSDARQIKSNLELIENHINNYLNELNVNNINMINYKYQKDKNLNGNYQINSLSTLISQKK